MMNTVCFPSPWLIHGLALLSSISPTPCFHSKGRKNQKNVDKRESVHLCSFQCNKSPLTGQLNGCWKCSGDTARVVWYYCMCSLCPRVTRAMGRGAKAMSWARGGSRAWSCGTALMQTQHLHSHWLGGSFNFWTLLHIGIRTGAPWRLVSLVPPLSLGGSNVIWSDTEEDLLLEPLGWNVLLKIFERRYEMAAAGRWQAICGERSLWHQCFPTEQEFPVPCCAFGLCVPFVAICWPGEGSLQ